MTTREMAASYRHALQNAGFAMQVCGSSLIAWERLKAGPAADLLITRIRFSEGQPHGVALAQMVSLRNPAVKVLFIAQPAYAEHARGIGPVLHLPVSPETLVEVVVGLMKAPSHIKHILRTTEA